MPRSHDMVHAPQLKMQHQWYRTLYLLTKERTSVALSNLVEGLTM